MLVCRHQAFVPASVPSVWALVGHPDRHPDWWPELVEVQGQSFGRDCSYCQVTRSEGGVSETMLIVESVTELKELTVRCAESGLYMRWLLSEAQGGTFVDAEFGIDRARATDPEPHFDPETARRELRHWLQSSLDGLAGASALHAGGSTA